MKNFFFVLVSLLHHFTFSSPSWAQQKIVNRQIHIGENAEASNNLGRLTRGEVSVLDQFPYNPENSLGQAIMKLKTLIHIVGNVRKPVKITDPLFQSRAYYLATEFIEKLEEFFAEIEFLYHVGEINDDDVALAKQLLDYMLKLNQAPDGVHWGLSVSDYWPIEYFSSQVDAEKLSKKTFEPKFIITFKFAVNFSEEQLALAKEMVAKYGRIQGQFTNPFGDAEKYEKVFADIQESLNDFLKIHKAYTIPVNLGKANQIHLLTPSDNSQKIIQVVSLPVFLRSDENLLDVYYFLDKELIFSIQKLKDRGVTSISGGFSACRKNGEEDEWQILDEVLKSCFEDGQQK